ncbi:MAG: UxaA family hydrolase [Bacillota bacterium]
MQRRAMRIDDHDMVAVLLEETQAADDCVIDLGDSQTTLTARQGIPFGHKVALVPIKAGDSVIKYGEVIGEATQDIEPGDWVHVHNLVSRRGRKEAE